MNRDLQVGLQVESDIAGIPDELTIRGWIVCALDGAAHTRPAEVSVRIVERAEMQALNKDFRHKDKPTNVLSFPVGEVAGLPGDEAQPLGDIVICAPVVSAEAAEQGKIEAAHWAHLLVHGTLHLLGYDHIEDDEAALMEQLETKILVGAGIPDPYGDH